MAKAPWVLTRDMFLSEQEVESLLDFLERRVATAPVRERESAATDQLILQSLIFSGLRNSEFCRLRVADTVVALRQSVFKVVGTPRQDRTVYIPDCVSAVVARYVNEVRPKMLPEGIASDDLAQPLVFSERGRPYERTGLYRRVVRILGAAGFRERASVQLLRHTYGYLGYLRCGGNLLYLQRQMGHAHPMVTSVYAEFVAEDYGELANRIAGEKDNASKAHRRLIDRLEKGTGHD